MKLSEIMEHNGKQWIECEPSEATLCLWNGYELVRDYDYGWVEPNDYNVTTTPRIQRYGGKFYKEAPEPVVRTFGDDQFRFANDQWEYFSTLNGCFSRQANPAINAMLDRLKELGEFTI